MYLLPNFHVDSWTVVGFLGQFLFFLSFVIQWYKSEKLKKSVLPKEFWQIRLFASAIMLVYVIHRADIVFLAGVVLQIAIYLRNIYFIRKDDKRE
jgi:lipid-A-disaccharide synthase-like uncharacterized protein